MSLFTHIYAPCHTCTCVMSHVRMRHFIHLNELCIYILMHMHIYICTCTRTYAHIPTHIHIYICTRIQTYSWADLFMCTMASRLQHDSWLQQVIHGRDLQRVIDANKRLHPVYTIEVLFLFSILSGWGLSPPYLFLTYSHKHTHTHTYTQVHTNTQTHMHTHARTHKHTHR